MTRVFGEDATPGPLEAMVKLRTAEMGTLIDTHERMAREAFQDGRHEACDAHECRVIELRRIRKETEEARPNSHANLRSLVMKTEPDPATIAADLAALGFGASEISQFAALHDHLAECAAGEDDLSLCEFHHRWSAALRRLDLDAVYLAEGMG